MSNSLAIATVTAALREMLQPVVSQAVNGAQVFFNRPDGASGNPPTPSVNVFLYQVTPNPAYRNSDLATRRSDGSLQQRPQAAFDLHYLFTFHGNDANLEPQLLLGAVASTLHSQPLLSPTAIAKVAADFPFLKASNLADQIERIRLTPTSLSLEEFSKLWSVFFQIEYSLSTAYQASVVLIESDDGPLPTLPVQARNFSVVPFRWPRIDRVISQAGVQQPILAGSTILIQGQQLRGTLTQVLIGGQELAPSNVTDTQATLTLPATLHAGAQGVQVAQKIVLGTPPLPHRGFESNVAPFVLRPSIVSASAASGAPGVTTVTLNLAPNVGVGQRVVLLLNNLAVTPATAFSSEPVVSRTDSNQMKIDISGVPPSTYLVRVQVDGAESLLTPDANGRFSGPVVVMP